MFSRAICTSHMAGQTGAGGRVVAGSSRHKGRSRRHVYPRRIRVVSRLREFLAGVGPVREQTLGSCSALHLHSVSEGDELAASVPSDV